MQPQYSKEIIVFFIAANIIVAGAAVFFFLLLRIQHKRNQLYQKQLLEKEFKTREESFLQISRDLHDEIGSSLSGISMLSQLAQQHLTQPNNGNADTLLQKINVYTSEVIEKVSDMAWLLKPNNESLSLLITKLKTYSLAAAGSKNIALEFSFNLDTSAKDLTIQQRKAIYLISKEAINNALKYSMCRNIYYSISSKNEKLKLYIKDDGNGFSMTSIQQGNGLANMKTRALESGGSFNISSEPGSGTIIEFDL